MATLSLGCKPAALTVSVDQISQRVINDMEGPSLHLTANEVDQLARRLRLGADNLREAQQPARA